MIVANDMRTCVVMRRRRLHGGTSRAFHTRMFMRSAISLAVCLAALLPLNEVAMAEENALDAFVAEVLARSPSLRAGALRRDASRREATAAGIYPDPTLNVMVDNVPEVAEMPMVRYQLGQMFMWPGKLGLMETAALRTADVAGANLETLRLQLRLDAKRSFYMLLLNARRREITKAARSLAATVANAALGRYGAGVAERIQRVCRRGDRRSRSQASGADVSLFGAATDSDGATDGDGGWRRITL